MQQVVENTNRLLGTKRTLEFFTKGCGSLWLLVARLRDP